MEWEKLFCKTNFKLKLENLKLKMSSCVTGPVYKLKEVKEPEKIVTVKLAKAPKNPKKCSNTIS